MESGTTTVASTTDKVTTAPAATAPASGVAAPAASATATTAAPATGSKPAARSTAPVGHAAHTHPLAAHAALVHAHAHAVTKVAPVAAPPVAHTSFVQNLQNQAVNWEPVIAILFFVVIIAVMWRMLKVMPKVMPQQIKPASHQAVGG